MVARHDGELEAVCHRRRRRISVVSSLVQIRTEPVDLVTGDSQSTHFREASQFSISASARKTSIWCQRAG